MRLERKLFPLDFGENTFHVTPKMILIFKDTQNKLVHLTFFVFAYSQTY